MKLTTLTQPQIQGWITQAIRHAQQGHLPAYIPKLAKVDRNLMAVHVQTVAGHVYAAGDVNHPFALMSVAKPFILLFLLEVLGAETVFQKVGIQPSDQPFNSLAQLKADQGWPRNPMLNSGAIALAALLPGQTAQDRCDQLQQWLNQQAGCRLMLDEEMLASVRSLKNQHNWDLAHLVLASEHPTSVEQALDTYNTVCCLTGTTADLARLGLLLVYQQAKIQPAHRRIVNTLMLTCGLYEHSAAFAVQVGLPTKSGVSGALLSIVPGEGAIALYSPALDAAGNSAVGLFILEQMAQTLNLSVFV
jgi:glutaminase